MQAAGDAAHAGPPPPPPPPAELHLAGAVRKVRRRARRGWLTSLVALSADFNREGPL